MLSCKLLQLSLQNLALAPIVRDEKMLVDSSRTNSGMMSSLNRIFDSSVHFDDFDTNSLNALYNI